MRYPINPKYLNLGVIMIINQWYGDNPNWWIYGPEGHPGIDMKTMGTYQYDLHNGVRVKTMRLPKERDGYIPICATHSGYITPFFGASLENGIGWGIKITNEKEGIQTLYWHLRSSWNSLASFKGAITTIARKENEWVREGAIIGIGGNTGNSTGPHLHFEVREKNNNGKWVKVDPIKRLRDQDIIMQDAKGRYVYQGKTITKNEFEATLLKIQNRIKQRSI